MRKLSEEKQQEIIRLYVDQRMSTLQVAKEIGVSSTCVSNIVKRQGLIPRGISEAKAGVKRGSNLPVAKIVRLYTSGMSSIQVGKQLGISKSAVLTILRRESIPRENTYESKSKYTSMQNDIVKAYGDGMSIGEVARALKIPRSAVRIQASKIGMLRTHLKFKGSLGKPYTDERRAKVRTTRKIRKEQGLYDHIYLQRTGYTYAEFQKQRPAFKRYHQQVRSVTQAQPLHALENYNKRGKAGLDGAYHIDHKFSIIEGFRQGIDPAIIGHISNLHMIPWEVNMVKQGECWIALNELMEAYISYQE